MTINRFTGRLSTVVIIVLSSFLILAWLYHSTDQPNRENNGFNRVISPIPVEALHTSDRKDNVIHIIGQSDQYYYFQTKDPSIYATAKKDLDSFSFFTLPFFEQEKSIIGNVFTSEIDYPNLFIYAGNSHAIFHFDLNTLNKSVHKPLGLFTRCARVSDSIFIIRGFNNEIAKKDQFFIRANVIQHQNQTAVSLTKRTNDAGFSTDGYLHYDPKTGNLVFISFFFNELLSFNPELNLKYKKSTIDTITTFYRAKEIKEGGAKSVTFDRPMEIVNYSSCVDNGILYNFSALRADNEPHEKFKNNADIDMYSIDSGNYVGSFWLPELDNGKSKFFRVFSDTLVALYENKIVTYKIPKFNHGN